MAQRNRKTNLPWCANSTPFCSPHYKLQAANESSRFSKHSQILTVPLGVGLHQNRCRTKTEIVCGHTGWTVIIDRWSPLRRRRLLLFVCCMRADDIHDSGIISVNRPFRATVAREISRRFMLPQDVTDHETSRHTGSSKPEMWNKKN